jgi:hypothetical protein
VCIVRVVLLKAKHAGYSVKHLESPTKACERGRIMAPDAKVASLRTNNAPAIIWLRYRDIGSLIDEPSLT